MNKRLCAAGKMREVAKISTMQKAGVITRVAGRVAGQQLGQNRLLRAGFSAVRITAEHFGRVLHLLWLQITGVFFLFFALAGSLAAWREYTHWQAGKIGPGKMVVALAFAAVFAWFGVSSFYSAARKARRN